MGPRLLFVVRMEWRFLQFKFLRFPMFKWLYKRENDPEPAQVEIEEPAKKKKSQPVPPKRTQTRLKWDAIRSAFDKHINPKVYSPSTMEDGFCKMCMGRLDHTNDESMYSAEAELCSVMWCQFPAPVPFLELLSLEVKLTIKIMSSPIVDD